MNVLMKTSTQPNNPRYRRNAAIVGSLTSHTTPGIGRHCQNTSASSRLASSTEVLRSTDFGTIVVHHFLNCGRAITLCCSANIVISTRLMTMDSTRGPAEPESIVFGTTSPLTKPSEYTMTTAKTRLATMPYRNATSF